MKDEKIELIALFNSMGESVLVSIYPHYSDEGEILEFGRVNVEGYFQTLFSEFGNIAKLEEEYKQLIEGAKEMLSQFADVSEEKKVARINELLSLFEA